MMSITAGQAFQLEQSQSPTIEIQKTPFKASKVEWWRATIFLLTLSGVGLVFPPAYLLLLIVMISAWRSDVYDFTIQLLILAGGYALFSSTKSFWIKPDDVALILGVVSIFVLRMSPMVKRLLYAMLAYVVIIFLLALTSDEIMSVQFLRMRNYLTYFFFFVPLAIFANRQFRIEEFFRKAITYSLVICVFYIIDAFVLQGHVLLPGVKGGEEVTFTNFYIAPFTTYFPRIYPYGLYLLALIVVPVARLYTLNKWQWALIFVALIAARTFSVIAGVVMGYILAIGNWRQMLRYFGIAAVSIACLYVVDKATGSFMRISSTIDQFIYFQEPEEILSEDDIDEDVVTFGTGRLAQIIPKFEALYGQHREWLGMGFLHPEKTKATKYIIDNTYYNDVEKSEEVVTGVEVSMLQTVLDIGYIGLIVQIAFFITLWAIVRHCRYSSYYLSVMIIFSIFGVGGFSGLIYFPGLFILGMALAATVLDERDYRDIQQQEYEERLKMER